MVDNEKILAGVEVLKEFKDKLTTLCEEYKSKVQEVCPEDYTSQYSDFPFMISLLTRLSFFDKSVTVKELEENGFSFSFQDNKHVCYKKEIDGIIITYSIDTEKLTKFISQTAMK